MPILFLDFESYYDQDYSLKKMAPPNYILDDRWETIGCAARVEGDATSVWIDGPDLPKYLAGFKPDKTTTVTFNALFDNCVLAWRYGFVPARLVCSMRMAAALRGHVLPSSSLAKVAEYLGLGRKGTFIENARGKHRADIIADPGFYRAYQAYALNDNDLNRDIFYKLLPEFPHSERRIMDRVLRCAVEPRFQIDQSMLTEHMLDLAADKVTMLRRAAGMPEDDGTGALNLGDQAQLDAALAAFAKVVRSTVKFQELLEARGVEIEYKPSTTDPERMIPAFAKTDDFMAGLMEHEDPDVQALAMARLGLRSTIEESRGNRILSISQLQWPSYCRGNMPVPLRYSGAHTHRLSGDWKLNLQNLPAARGKSKSKLRKALKAPPGHKVVVADKSQIECRINAWLCGQEDLLNIFRRKGDPYSVLASAIFGFTVDPNVHKTERFIGKGGELGLGFGCGDKKFYAMVIRQARTLGMDIPKLLEMWTPDLAKSSVGIYRTTHSAIAQTWRRLDGIISTAWVGNGPPMQFGPCIIGHGFVEGPSGLRMNYGNPHRDDQGEYWYTYGRKRHKMYGSKFLENIVQFLARINTMHDSLRISDRGYPFALQSHDELAFIVPEAEAQKCLDTAIEEMCRPPSWGKLIPLGAAGDFGDTYGDAK